MIVALIVLIIIYILFNILTDWYYFESTVVPCFFVLCIIAMLSVCAHFVAIDEDPYYTYDYRIVDKVMVKTTKACLPAKYDIDFCDVVSMESIPLDQIKFENRSNKDENDT